MHRTTSGQGRRAVAGAFGAVIVALSLAGCGGDDGGSPPVAAEPTDVVVDAATVPYGLVSADQAQALVDAGAVVVDVRTPPEFDTGRIAGAQLIDVGDPSFVDLVGALDPDTGYLVYCQSGNRSRTAVATMAELGIERVWELDGGIAAYAAAGFPIDR